MYIILASNASMKVVALGVSDGKEDGGGKPFTSEASANAYARRLSKESPHLDFLVLPIERAAAMLPTPAGAR